MPDLIMLRLKPSKPVAPGEFTASLSGLTIGAFDLTFADSVGGALLVSATEAANTHLASITNNNVTIGNTSILQRATPRIRVTLDTEPDRQARSFHE
jgi:predicted alpha/beta hydrolase family esterase